MEFDSDELSVLFADLNATESKEDKQLILNKIYKLRFRCNRHSWPGRNNVVKIDQIEFQEFETFAQLQAASSTTQLKPCFNQE